MVTRLRGAVSLVASSAMGAELEGAARAGFVSVLVPPPGPSRRGQLALVIEENIEEVLGRLGAAPPGVGAVSRLDSTLGDQLYRARLIGAPGIALGFPALEGIANLAGALDAEDSAVLRWWVAASRERPLRLYFAVRDSRLGVYGAPMELGRVIDGAAASPVRPSEPAPAPEPALVASVEAMELSRPPPSVEEGPRPAPAAATAALPAFEPKAPAAANSAVPTFEPEVPLATETLADAAVAAEAPVAAEPAEVAASATAEPATSVATEPATTEHWDEHRDARRSPLSALALELSDLGAASAVVVSHALPIKAISRPPRSPLEAPRAAAPRPAAPRPAAPPPAAPAPSRDNAVESPTPTPGRDTASASIPVASAPATLDRVIAAVAPQAPPAAAALSAPVEASDPPSPIAPDAATQCGTWMEELEGARGPKPLSLVERMFVSSYVPLRDAIELGIADGAARLVADAWATSFAKSYTEAFDALRLRGKRPCMVLDVPDLAQRLARLHGARAVQLILVDGLRFDVGLRMHERLRIALDRRAVLTERLLLWSALPTTTDAQLELLGRGPEGLKELHQEPDSVMPVARGRAAATPRRVKAGHRELLKLDVIAARLTDRSPLTAGELDDLAATAADSLSQCLRRLPPRTLAFVFGDHGFALDERHVPTEGGSSPDEVLVPGYAWLVGNVH